jgi:hypothetical protein
MDETVLGVILGMTLTLTIAASIAAAMRSMPRAAALLDAAARGIDRIEGAALLSGRERAAQQRVLQDERVVAIERELVLAKQEAVLAKQELSVTRDEMTRLRQALRCAPGTAQLNEIARLHGTGIEGLEARELVRLRTELEEGLRRVRDAELRRAAEERVASQTNSFLCPIGCELMREPVMAADGHTYERVQIEEWIQRKGDIVKSPMTIERLAHTMLTPNYALKASIDEAIENVMRELRQAPPARPGMAEAAAADTAAHATTSGLMFVRVCVCVCVCECV